MAQKNKKTVAVPRNVERGSEGNENAENVGASHGAGGFVRNNWVAILVIAAIGIAAGIALVAVKNGSEKKTLENQAKANLYFSRIKPYYESGDYQKALYGDSLRRIRNDEVIGLIEIVDKYEKTGAGKTAALFAGKTLIETQKYSEAIKYFKIAAESESPIVATGAYAGRANAAEALGEREEAYNYYLKAAQNADADQNFERYAFYAALNAEEIGKKSEAEELFKEIIEKNETSQFASLSKAGLLRLGTEIEQ